MAKLRKTLGSPQAPYIVSLMRLIQTQSKTTIANWCLDYAEVQILPVYAKAYPGDGRVGMAIGAARSWLAGEVKLPYVKRIILDECHAAARQAEDHPAAQAAARAVGQAASVIHAPAHALGIAFYGTAAIAYDRVGTGESPEVYEKIAAEECAKMEAALRVVAIADEKNPAKINWRF